MITANDVVATMAKGYFVGKLMVDGELMGGEERNVMTTGVRPDGMRVVRDSIKSISYSIHTVYCNVSHVVQSKTHYIKTQGESSHLFLISNNQSTTVDKQPLLTLYVWLSIISSTVFECGVVRILLVKTKRCRRGRRDTVLRQFVVSKPWGTPGTT